jgi:hypothetical protein
MKKFKYPALVIKEAKNLKKLATPEELNQLNFDRLHPQSEYRCVYGLMTGHCFSDRANLLISECAPRVYIHTPEAEENDKILAKTLNGKLKEPRKEMIHWSPIEVFIFKKKNQESGANERLVKYIKGEIKAL